MAHLFGISCTSPLLSTCGLGESFWQTVRTVIRDLSYSSAVSPSSPIRNREAAVCVALKQLIVGRLEPGRYPLFGSLEGNILWKPLLLQL